MSVPPSAIDPLTLWILTSQVEGMWPLEVLTAPNAGRIMNLHFPAVDRKRLTDALQSLFEAGWILAERRRRPLPWAGRDELERWIESKEQYPDEIHLGLTSTGGRIWERECGADWSKFLNAQGCRAVEENGHFFFPYMHFEGSTLSRLAEYASENHSPHPGYVFTRMKIRELRPWKATYWKVLPAGYRITCHYRQGPEDFALWRRRRRDRVDLKWYEDPPREPEVSSLL